MMKTDDEQTTTQKRMAHIPTGADLRADQPPFSYCYADLNSRCQE